MIKTAFINSFVDSAVRPQGLKPASFVVLSGTAEAVPFPKPIHENGLAWVSFPKPIDENQQLRVRCS
jgi:hypothetical protein